MKTSPVCFDFIEFSRISHVRSGNWDENSDDEFAFSKPLLPYGWGSNIEKRDHNDQAEDKTDEKKYQDEQPESESVFCNKTKAKHKKRHNGKPEKFAVVEDNFSQTITVEQCDMHQLERLILKKIVIRRVYGKLYYFNGKSYYPLDKNLFLQQLRIALPEKILGRIATYSRMEEVYKFLQTNPDIDLEVSSKMCRDAGYFIAFENGVYDVLNDRLLEHSPNYPLLFDVSAKYVAKKCESPCFEDFLDKATQKNDTLKKLIWQMIGYIMLQSIDAKCFFILGTAANSGKSLLGEFICSLFAEELVGNVPLTELGGRFALGSLWKKAVNVSMDLPTRTLSEQEVSQIKMLTGERRIRTEEKYEPVTTTHIHCKSLFATNGKITLKVPDEAFWDRVVFVPFMHSVPEKERDRRLLDKLLEEKDAIASKAARAAKKLIRNNFCFNMPIESRLMLNEWRGSISDTITDFLEKQCIYGPEHEIFSEELYAAYKWYCVSQAQEPETRIAFSRKISKLAGVTQRKKRRTATDNPIWLFEGIAIRDEREG